MISKGIIRACCVVVIHSGALLHSSSSPPSSLLLSSSPHSSLLIIGRLLLSCSCCLSRRLCCLLLFSSFSFPFSTHEHTTLRLAGAAPHLVPIVSLYSVLIICLDLRYDIGTRNEKTTTHQREDRFIKPQVESKLRKTIFPERMRQ